jgi:hypothetical protein
LQFTYYGNYVYNMFTKQLIKRGVLNILKGEIILATKKESEKEREVTFEIVERIGVISENAKGWKKELNLVKWNDKAPKYDLREWDEEHEKMGKGITLTGDEARVLFESLNGLSL